MTHLFYGVSAAGCRQYHRDWHWQLVVGNIIVIGNWFMLRHLLCGFGSWLSFVFCLYHLDWQVVHMLKHLRQLAVAFFVNRWRDIFRRMQGEMSRTLVENRG